LREQAGSQPRRLKREIERRGTLGGSPLAIEPDTSLKRIPTQESDSDLFRSYGPDAAALSCQVEPPQSVVQGCSVWPGQPTIFRKPPDPLLL
jgi:hypothetical protein